MAITKALSWTLKKTESKSLTDSWHSLLCSVFYEAFVNPSTMEKQTRRAFVATAAAMSASTIAMGSSTDIDSKEKKQLVHHVYFWLKNPESKEDLNSLIVGLTSLKQIKQLRVAKIGIPASTEKRDVVDNSYSVSWLNIFDDVKAHDEYQVHPVHVKFVESCKHLWEKVVVYDSKDI